MEPPLQTIVVLHCDRDDGQDGVNRIGIVTPVAGIAPAVVFARAHVESGMYSFTNPWTGVEIRPYVEYTDEGGAKRQRLGDILAFYGLRENGWVLEGASPRLHAYFLSDDFQHLLARSGYTD